MLYIYRRHASTGARDVVESLQELGINARRLNDLARAHFGQGVRSGDHVVCWGEGGLTLPAGVQVLNNAPVVNKFTEAQTLAAAGVPTVLVSRTRPVVEAARPVVDPFIAESERVREVVSNFSDAPWLRGPVFADAVAEVMSALSRIRTVNSVPVPLAPTQPQATWLPRRNNHVGGSDLLTIPAIPDYYSRKEPIIQEYRIHSFKGKSIRAGQKAPRVGFPSPHAWIRSYDAGWFINYEGFESTQAMRELAASAVRALGLDFGAVDIGQKQDNSLIVLEVNRAPGSEGGTSNAYAATINRWIQGEFNEQTDRNRGRSRRAA